MIHFPATGLTGPERRLQQDIRDFLAAELPPGSFEPGLGADADRDPGFSKKLAERGWLGMALPARYGGGDRTAADRFIVVEELLRSGAPVAHHWIAERQSGPIINRFGTEEQKQRFLPLICQGEVSFSIGMSEPDSGSDLASIRTRATATDGGWLVNGTKVWTTGAHTNDWLMTLARTSADGDRHGGLSQLIVDLRSPGVTINPIPFLDGSVHFNEVVLSDVFVPGGLVLGEVGNGWAQATSELTFERGGPDRWLSTYLVVEEFLREQHGELPEAALEFLGAAVARWWALRRMSLAVARLIDAGQAPGIESALVKEMGTRFEQDVLAGVVALVEFEPLPLSASHFERLLSRAVLISPAFTIRGGTVEILRSVIGRGLGR